MKTKTLGLLSIITIAVCWKAAAQIYDTNNEVVETFAGSGLIGLVNGQGALTMFNSPSSIVADSVSNLFVWDGGNYVIRKIAPSGVVSTFAGGGSSGLGALGFGSPNSLASFTNFNFDLAGAGAFQSMTIDHSNDIWILTLEFLVRLGSDSSITVFSSNLPGLSGYTGLCVDSSNTLYCTGQTGIYRFSASNSTWTIFVGSGNYGSQDGNGAFCSFDFPSELAADAANNIYVWDSGDYKIRRIDQKSNVVTIAGGSPANVDGAAPSFYSISAMSFDSFGNLLLSCGSSIRRLSASTNAVTLAGRFTGYTNGPGDIAAFDGATGVCAAQGMIFVADSGNERIRQISFNPQPQVVTGANLGLAAYSGLTINGVVGRTYQIQTSPDLTNWNTASTLLLNSSPFLWFDQNPVSGNKFYRALLLP